MRLIAQVFLLLIFLFELGACVSVSIKPKSPERSKSYTTVDPASPFEEFETDQADRAWQNPKTGNTIAVISECSDRDPDLKVVENDTLNALSNSEVIHTENISYSDRDAIRTLARGKVDGINVKLDLILFKKNSCVFTLSQLGREKGFDKDKTSFEIFLKGFNLP
jgi:hypothetical protein